MQTNRPTRPPRHRAARALLDFALAFATAMVGLVIPVGSPGNEAFAAARLVSTGVGAIGAADLSAAAAESSLVALINADRTGVGLRPLVVDARVSVVAHERSTAMAAAGQLSHVQPDGRTAVDLSRAAGITWYSVGETIGWNNWPSLRDSTSVVNQGWLGSPEHAAIIRSADYNYLGVGLSVTAGGDRYWTAIFLRGPDWTPPWARMLSPTSGSYVTLASGRRVRLVTWSWVGDDRPLAALTSGLRSFEVQRRVDSGAWVSIWTSTARRSWSTSVPVGHRVQVRVRARDNAGNVGAWSPAVGLAA